jgi:hypothetical protein
MAFLPTICEKCAKIQLLDQAAVQHGRFTCSDCGGNAKVVPVCSFSEADLGFFNDVSQVIAEGVVPPTEARALASRIERALAARNTQILESLTMRLPGLLPAQAAAGTNHSAQRRVLMLLRAVLEARALAEPSPNPDRAAASMTSTDVID